MRTFTIGLSFGRSDADAQRQLADAQRAAAESDRAALEAMTLVQQERAALEAAKAEHAILLDVLGVALGIEDSRQRTAAQVAARAEAAIRDLAQAQRDREQALRLLDEARAADRAAIADLRRDVTSWQTRCREAEGRDAEHRRELAAALGLPDGGIVPGWAAIIDAARFLPRPSSRSTRQPLACYVCGAEPGTPCAADCRLREDMRAAVGPDGESEMCGLSPTESEP